MSKQYKVKMSMDLSNLEKNSPYIIEQTVSGLKIRTAPEVFALICTAAINQANPRVSHEQLKHFRKIIADLKGAATSGEFTANKTDLDIIKLSIQRNRQWPNDDEILGLIDQVLDLLGKADEVA